MQKYFTKQKLLERIKEEFGHGIAGTYQYFILPYERSGQLVCRRNGRGRRLFTQEDINEIIEAIRKDGKGFKWHYKE